MKIEVRGLVALILCAFAVGCDGGSGHDHSGDTAAHGHLHTAPHGGALVVLGDEFAHLEWVLTPETGVVDIFVLDGEADAGVRIPAHSLQIEVTVGEKTALATAEGVENVLSGETVGDTSNFRVKVPELVGAEHFEVTLRQITVRGVEFVEVSFSYPEGNEAASHEH